MMGCGTGGNTLVQDGDVRGKSQECSCLRFFATDTIILNHIGGLLRVGPYANRDHKVLATWRHGIAAVAECPNVTIKLGGIGMSRTGFDWHARSKPIGSEERPPC
jgi:L-fuconolactonase